MDQSFYSAAYGGWVVVKDEWRQKIKDMWYKALGVTPPPLGEPPAAFVPSFRTATGSDGLSEPWELNSEYFATRETAQFIADKFGDGTVTPVEFGGSGGLFTASEKEFHIVLKNGRMVNAGILASYYTRNPDDKYPGLAEILIKKVLEA